MSKNWKGMFYQMSDTRGFKTKLIGYSKNEVFEYINKIDGYYKYDVERLKAEIERLIKVISEQKTQIEEFKIKSDAISDALLKSQTYAQATIDAANTKADEIIHSAQKSGEQTLKGYKEMERFQAELLENFKKKIADLQSKALETIKVFEQDLRQIMG